MSRYEIDNGPYRISDELVLITLKASCTTPLRLTFLDNIVLSMCHVNTSEFQDPFAYYPISSSIAICFTNIALLTGCYQIKFVSGKSTAVLPLQQPFRTTNLLVEAANRDLDSGLVPNPFQAPRQQERYLHLGLDSFYGMAEIWQ